MKSQTALVLVMVLARSTLGIEAICDATRNVSCHGTPGQPLYLQLIKTTSKFDLRFYRKESSNDSTRIFRFAENNITFHNPTSLIQKRWTFSSDNGSLILIINPFEPADLGIYTVQAHLTNGALVASNTIELSITKLSKSSTKDEARRVEENRKLFYKAIMVVSGCLGVFFLCLTISGGIYIICKRSAANSEHQKLELESAEVSIMKSQMKLPELSVKRERTNDYGEVEEWEAHTPVQQEDGREEVGEYEGMEEREAHTPVQQEDGREEVEEYEKMGKYGAHTPVRQEDGREEVEEYEEMRKREAHTPVQQEECCSLDVYDDIG